MENRKKRLTVVLLLGMLLFVSCRKLDPLGFLYSTTPVNERIKQSLEWNKTHPIEDIQVSGSDYILVVAADSHVGGTLNLDALITEANKPANSGLVMVGDLTTGNKEDYVTFKQELDSKNSVPAFLMSGNHDLFFDGWGTFQDFFGSSTYSFKVKTNDTTDLFICLDSGGGTLGWRQLEWLKDLLEKERKNARYCILFSHVNFFREHRTGSTNPLVEELRVMIDLCYSYSINMVINGHDHNRSEDSFGITRFVTLDALEDDFENASYMKLQVKAIGLETTFVEL
jgi:3',5'-cyclic AMP phosphodiesterase CpdA